MSNMQSNKDRGDRPPPYPITESTTAAECKNFQSVAKVNLGDGHNRHRCTNTIPLVLEMHGKPGHFAQYGWHSWSDTATAHGQPGR